MNDEVASSPPPPDPSSPSTEQQVRPGFVQRLFSGVRDTLGEPFRLALPLGAGVLVTFFATLGIEGDLLSRLLRNEPKLVLISFLLATIGVILPLFTLSEKVKDWWAALGAFLLLVGFGLGMFAAIRTTGEREQPNIKLTRLANASESSSSEVRVQVEATGSNLASSNRMLLRVVILPPTLGMGDAKELCSTTKARNGDLESVGDVELPQSARVVAWQESGPDQTGNTSNTTTLAIDTATHGWVCAHAVLFDPTSAPEEPGTSDPPEAGDDDARFSTAIVDLQELGQSN